MRTSYPSLPRLREYLDDAGFANLYRYVVSVLAFPRTPRAITWQSRAAVNATETYLAGDLHGRRLLWTLMATAPVPRDRLSAQEIAVAEALVEDGLLAARAGAFHPAGYQLICVEHVYLFIDGRVNFPTSPHEVYIGGDTLSLLFYLGGVAIGPATRALDLGTGTGAIGLVAARRGAAATLTDVSEAALELAHVNRALNGLEDRVAIRREDLAATLAHGDWELITFNPPFIAIPDELAAPLYARGHGRDGLGLLRVVLARLPQVLAPRGEALFVADFLGDARAPFVIDDLAPLARDLAIELYIDDIREVRGHVEALAQLVAGREPHPPYEDARRRIDELLTRELGASHLHLAVIRIRRDGPPGLLVHNRWRGVTAASSRPAASSDG